MFSHLPTRQQYGFFSIAVLGLAICAYFGANRMRPVAPIALTGLYTEPPSIAPPATVQTVEPPSTADIVVHVAGAVKQPGVVRARSDARVVDAIRLAGGSKPNADLDRLNLAAKLKDGTQLYVPTREEAAPKASRSRIRAPRRQPPPLRSDPVKPFNPGPISVEYEAAPEPSNQYAPRIENEAPIKVEPPVLNAKVSLNSATLSELDSLPGVGPAIAQKILDYRRTRGGFRSIEQIIDVPGIGPKKFEKMRHRLTL